MFPFLVILAVLGADGIRIALAGRVTVLRVVTGALGAAVLVQGVAFTIDLCTGYPNRAALYFDTGEIAAITSAREAARSHTVFLSNTLDQPYIEAFFKYLPAPPPQPETDDATPGLAALGMQVVTPAVVESGHPSAGDILVLSALFDPPPPTGWALVAVERAPANPLDASAPQPVLFSVYRFGG